MTTRTFAIPAVGRPVDYLALTKPDVSFLVVLTTLAGYVMGANGPIDWLRLAHTVLGTTLVAAGTAALNHYIERDRDALMRRTANRPLPSRTLLPSKALLFGAVLILAGTMDLLLSTNWLATLMAVLTSALYLGVYTPLKTRTTLATLIGAFPGAIPPMIGWAAARGSLGLGSWILFAIVFLWQFPHFHAIAWIYREDYGRAGIRMLPVVDPEGRATFAQILFCVAILIPVSMLASLAGMAGVRYYFSALVVGLLFAAVALWAAASKTNVRAKWLMHASVLHLPVLLGLMAYDKFWG